MIRVRRIYRHVTCLGGTARRSRGIGFAVHPVVLSMASVYVGCSGPRAEPVTCPAIEVSVEADGPSGGNRSIALADGRHILLTDAPLVTTADITEASGSLTEGQSVLNIRVTPERARQVQRYTEQNVGRTLVFLVDGRVVRTPRIRDPITGDGFFIGPLEPGEAERLADAINTGCSR